jgi:type 1 glutamine amidotransferase
MRRKRMKKPVMKIPILLSLAVFALSNLYGSNESEQYIISRITVDAGKHTRIDSPLTLLLDALTTIHEQDLSLYELVGDNAVPVPVQFSGGASRNMHWLLTGTTDPHKKRVFELRREKALAGAKLIKVKKDQDDYILLSQDKPVAQYNAATIPAPEGANPANRRSGYIHPLYAPNGAVLTVSQPTGYVHHFGIMNPWAKTTFRGEVVDFWNLGKEQGTVRSGAIVSFNEGEVYGSLQVLHEHVAWPDTPREAIAMNELQEIRVYNRNDGAFLMEINSRLNPVEDLTLEEYVYGGLLLRATEYWTHENSRFFNSEGMNREQASEKRTRWCVVYGDTPMGDAGILIMGHPSNFNHPEPLRVWNSDAARPRDYFINFSPTMNTSWVLESGTEYTLRYRMLIFEGKMDQDEASLLWNDYSDPPAISWESQPPSNHTAGKWDNRTGEIANTRILVYTRVGDGGFVHNSIPSSVEALKKLAFDRGFTLDISDDPSVFTDDNLKKYHALIFSNTNNDVFNTDMQRVALKRYIQAGGGFVGIHIAIGTERNWEWYKKMTGATFDRHPPYQKMSVNTRDPYHPSSSHLPDPWIIEDEPYFLKEYNPDVRVIMTHDLSSIEDTVEKPLIFGNDYPSVWCNTFDGGRQWYTAYGHAPGIFEDKRFMQHILGGIKWVIADGLPDYRKAYSTSIAR